MRRHTLVQLFTGLVLATMPAWLIADQSRGAKPGSADLATAKPGRDPNQPIDEEYTRKI